MIGRLVWKMIDPLLLRIQRRLEHLNEQFPSDRRERQLRELGCISSSAKLFADSDVTSLAPRDHLNIGDHSNIRGHVRLLTAHSRITIGRDCYLGPGSNLWAADAITIGDFVLIAHMVDIIDNNSHSLRAGARRQEARDVFERKIELDFAGVEKAPVTIHDDVWIGAKSVILKGVTIGRGAVIAAGTVVTRNVEAFTVVAGNPMQVLKRLPEEA